MADRLVEGLSFEWRSERNAEVLLVTAAAATPRPEVSARLYELSASSRARRARLERRLQALRAGGRLAAVPERPERLDQVLETALSQARAAADRYGALAELARRLADPETAFACELNRIGAEESAGVVEVLLAVEVERSARSPSLLALEPQPSP